MMRPGDRIPKEFLDEAVVGVNLVPGTLRDQLGPGVTLLVFLRHFGCIFCRETLADLRDAASSEDGLPPVLFFFQGSPIEGKATLRRDWPEARAIADPEARFYEAFGVTRGGLVEMFRPAVWMAKRAAEAKGHRNGPRSGDIWRMPGMFLARGEQICWSHEYGHAADHPDYAEIGRMAAELEPAG